MASPGFHDIQNVKAKVKILINAQLKSVLKKEGLAVSGVKAAMQERIINQLETYASNRSIESYNRLKALVNNPDNPVPSPSTNSHNYHTNIIPPSNQPQFTLANGLARPGPPNLGGMQPQPYRGVQLSFKDSPFYTLLEPLTSVLECKVRETTRDQLDSKIVLRAEIAERLLGDPTLRVMIYSASEPIPPFSKVDISFPHQVEIKVNLDDVKANLRGLKNKPGTTRPADVTQLLRKKGTYENSLTVTYALTNKKFYLVVNLVKQHRVEDLVSKLKSGRMISKDRVIREMISKAQDSDIVATSSVMSLKCPLSTLRISVPCRSTICTHNQCFDALSFLQLQEQAPTWTCPLCNKIISFEALEVDQYVNDILEKTPKHVDQVTIEPDGKWSRISEADNYPRRNSDQASDEDDDDELVEIKDMPHAASAMDEKSAVTGSQSKLPGEKSTTPSISSGFAKRSIGEVIDLTFSSDEEDEPPRPPKRQLKTSLSGSLLRFPRSENTRPHLSEGNLGDPKPAKTISTPNFLCQNLIGPS